jgi:hypothetical protein
LQILANAYPSITREPPTWFVSEPLLFKRIIWDLPANVVCGDIPFLQRPSPRFPVPVLQFVRDGLHVRGQIGERSRSYGLQERHRIGKLVQQVASKGSARPGQPGQHDVTAVSSRACVSHAGRLARARRRQQASPLLHQLAPQRIMARPRSGSVIHKCSRPSWFVARLARLADQICAVRCCTHGRMLHGPQTRSACCCGSGPR